MIAGLVLCGGEGRRFGGADKPLQLLAGKPLIAHVCDRLRDAVTPLLVSCNRNLADYAAYAEQLIVDAEPGLGPLGGIASAWPHVPSELLFVCPGDAPNLNPSLVQRLASARADSGRLAAYAHDGSRAQPLFLLLQRTVAAPLQNYLAHGERSVHGLLTRIDALAVDCQDLAASFVNVNTAADLQALARHNAARRD